MRDTPNSRRDFPSLIHNVESAPSLRKGIKVRRVVRRFELWSVAKVAFVFHACCYLVTLGVGVLLWKFANTLGTVEKLEDFFVELGWEKFSLDGEVLFRALSLGGLLLAAINVLATVLLAFFYNCVSGIIGGLVVSVLEQAPPVPSVPATAAAPASPAAAGAAPRGKRGRAAPPTRALPAPAGSAIPNGAVASTAGSVRGGAGAGGVAPAPQPVDLAARPSATASAAPRPIEAGKRGRRGKIDASTVPAGAGANLPDGRGAGSNGGHGNGAADNAANGWLSGQRSSGQLDSADPGDWTLAITPERAE